MADNVLSSGTRSQRADVEKLGLLEKLTILPNLIMSYADGFIALFTRLFRGFDQLPPTLYRNFMYTFVRGWIRRMSVRQLHAVSPPTDSAYATLCKKRSLNPNTITLEDGTTAHWIGPSAASHLIINFHGGGYVLPAGLCYLEFMYQLQSHLTQQGKSVSVLFLSYDLAPVAQYPRQLQQAAALLDHVVNDLHHPPQNIILSGDSAGGNLALALMSHISHPHPSTATPIKPISLTAPLRGLVLTSPWISFRVDLPAFTTNARKDLLESTAGIRWAEAFMGAKYPFPEALKDEYNQACQAADEWWEDLQVKGVLIVAGKDEVLVDSIRELGETLTRVKDKVQRSRKGHLEEVEILIAEGEAHDMTNLDVEFGFTEPGKQAQMIRSWVAEKL